MEMWDLEEGLFAPEPNVQVGEVVWVYVKGGFEGFGREDWTFWKSGWVDMVRRRMRLRCMG